jgi:hypothetical protein
MSPVSASDLSAGPHLRAGESRASDRPAQMIPEADRWVGTTAVQPVNGLFETVLGLDVHRIRRSDPKGASALAQVTASTPAAGSRSNRRSVRR